MSDAAAGDPTDAPSPPTPVAQGLRRASAILAAGTMVSRVLGFFSAAILAWILGQTGGATNAFATANGLPNSIYSIVAAGVLSAVLVPQIVRATKSADGGQDFVNRLLTLGICVFFAATVVVTLLAAPVTSLFTLGSTTGLGGGEGYALAVAFAVWCLPQIFFYALYSLLGEVYNARGVFGPFTWAPALNNVVVIIGLLIFAGVYGVDPAHRDPTTWDAGQVALLGGGATLGIAAQALVLVAFWRRTGFGFRPDFRWRGVGLGGTLKAAAWSLCSVVVIQLGGIVQSGVALSISPEDPATRVIGTAWLIFMLPHSIIAISIATPYFTRLSGHAADHDIAAMKVDLSSAFRVIGMLIAGAGAALAAAAIPFATIFTRRPDEIVGVATVLLAFLAALLAYSSLFVLQRGFYAFGDTRTPFFYQIVQIALFVTGAGAAFLFVPSESRAVALALASSLATTVQAIVSAVFLRRRLGGSGGTALVRRYGTYALATVPAAAAGLGVLALLGGLPVASGGFAVDTPVTGFISVILVGGVAMGVYLAVLALARIPEVREIGSIARRVVRR